MDEYYIVLFTKLFMLSFSVIDCYCFIHEKFTTTPKTLFTKFMAAVGGAIRGFLIAMILITFGIFDILYLTFTSELFYNLLFPITIYSAVALAIVELINYYPKLKEKYQIN